MEYDPDNNTQKNLNQCINIYQPGKQDFEENETEATEEKIKAPVKNYLEEKLNNYGSMIAKELEESAKKKEMEERLLNEKKNMS